MDSDPDGSTDILEYDSTTNTYYTSLEWTTHDPSVAVVELIGRLLEVDPIELEPLASSIDPAAVDALLQGQRTRPQAGECTISFTYLDHRVRVSSDGHVAIEPPSEPESIDRFRDTTEANCDDDDRTDPTTCTESARADENGDGDCPCPD